MARVKQSAVAYAHADECGAEMERPVDLVHLARYTMGNRDLEHEVLNLFSKQSVIYLDRLRQAADTNTWHEAAHTLKGSARGIGAWQVADVVAAIEELNFSADDEGRRDKLLELTDVIDRANRFIDGLLAEKT